MAVVAALAVGPPPAAASFTPRSPLYPWTVTPSPDPGGGDDRLNAVSCSSGTTCVAVGSEGSGGGTGALIESSAGGSWTVVHGPELPGDSTLDGVSCVSAVACVAVGTQETGSGPGALVETLRGATWSVSPLPPVVWGGSALLGVSCTEVHATVTCDAVGYLDGEGGPQPLVSASTNGVWTIDPTPRVAGASGGLDGVSCASATACTAVGYSEVSDTREALAETLTGGTWSVGAGAAIRAGSSLSGVSCASADACLAVGRAVGAPNISRPLAESWNGTRWESEPTPDPGGQGLLTGVSCATVTDCVAGGSASDGSGHRSLLVSWNGLAWSDTPGPSLGPLAGDLTATSCVSVDSCRAVGTSNRDPSVDRTLVLNFEVPPPVVAEVSFSGGSTHPRITITGNGFGSRPVGAATGCSTTGTDYPGADLTFQDVTAAWAAGTTGNCVGLVVSHYSPTRISYSFGSAYGTEDPPIVLSTSDAFSVIVDGATCSEVVPKPSSVSHRPGSASTTAPGRVVTLSDPTPSSGLSGPPAAVPPPVTFTATTPCV